jgi:hypothetical protein
MNGSVMTSSYYRNRGGSQWLFRKVSFLFAKNDAKQLIGIQAPEMKCIMIVDRILRCIVRTMEVSRFSFVPR